MKRVARDFFDGKATHGSPELSYIHEHILCRNYGCLPDDVRNMDYYDFLAHLYVCLAREDADLAHQAALAGATKPSGITAPTRGQTVQQQTKILKF